MSAALHVDPRVPVGIACLLVMGGMALGGFLWDTFVRLVARARGYQRAWIPAVTSDDRTHGATDRRPE